MEESIKVAAPTVKILFIMIDGLGDLNHKDIDCKNLLRLTNLD